MFNVQQKYIRIKNQKKNQIHISHKRSDNTCTHISVDLYSTQGWKILCMYVHMFSLR